MNIAPISIFHSLKRCTIGGSTRRTTKTADPKLPSINPIVDAENPRREPWIGMTNEKRVPCHRQKRAHDENAAQGWNAQQVGQSFFSSRLECGRVARHVDRAQEHDREGDEQRPRKQQKRVAVPKPVDRKTSRHGPDETRYGESQRENTEIACALLRCPDQAGA